MTLSPRVLTAEGFLPEAESGSYFPQGIQAVHSRASTTGHGLMLVVPSLGVLRGATRRKDSVFPCSWPQDTTESTRDSFSCISGPSPTAHSNCPWGISSCPQLSLLPYYSL
jgi:hypothetical protein